MSHVKLPLAEVNLCNDTVARIAVTGISVLTIELAIHRREKRKMKERKEETNLQGSAQEYTGGNINDPIATDDDFTLALSAQRLRNANHYLL